MKPAGFFAVRFLVLYAVLVAPWPGVQNAYALLFRGGGNLVFGSTGSARFVAGDSNAGAPDTYIEVRQRRGHNWVRLGVNSREVGYVPTILCAALILATPITWARRPRALLLGMFGVSVFIGLRLAVMVLHASYLDLQGQPVWHDHFWARTLFAGVIHVGVGSTASCLAPILIWILVTFRRDDIAMILAKPRSSADCFV